MKPNLDASTIFCGTDDASIVLSMLSASAPPDWVRVEVHFDEGAMSLVRRVFAPDSDFSRVIIGMHNYFRERADDSRKQRVLQLLETCDLMIGLRFGPPLIAESDSRWAAVLRVVQATRGLLFDGQHMLDDTGSTLL
jgi:hypothetical protein